VDRSWDAGNPAGGSLPALPPNLDPRGRRKHEQPAARGALRSGRLIVKILAAALSVFLVVYIGYLWHTVRGFNDVQRLHLSSLGGTTTDAKTGKTTKQTDIDGKDENLLIAGNDDRSGMTNAQVRQLKVGRDGGSLNTDSMMIVHVPADGSKATLISLPRDSYVAIPGYGMNRLNAAYALAYNDAKGDANAKRAAGADELVHTVENLTGLNIDHFVQVSLLGFVNISDAVGGVTVNMCNAVDDSFARNRAAGLDGGSGLVLPKGKTTIEGVRALEFVRQRHFLTHGDLDRTARQRYFLTAAFRTVASAGTLLNLSRLRNLVSAVDKSIYVDSGLNILDLARQMSNLSANNIIGKAIPYVDDWRDSPVGDVLRIDPAKVKTFVKNLIGTDTAAYKNAKTVAPGSVAVQVENGGAANGAATTAAHALDKAGFRATVAQSTPYQTSTEIRYAPGMESAAKTLAGYVPGSTVRQGDVSSLTLLIGSDNLKALSALPTTHKAPTAAKSKAAKAIDSGCIN
jgi:LCP family protein required for cell wall assembly